ncbi:MAG: undecaprenyl-diphosphate phosphatase [Alphaproteobacteria bacterium]|nr:undecaprenyl-diphosphate phosphatase [Rhodospirillaceae bacterium]MBT6511534.1 undecaprenyl-diphosphate phosphatase [Rhodospirillaceae bacterium]MBT7612420.1 undecaprenyl-diphosphate phosphatase [Rhodospirillaceae bacterium]MBT7649217.1 undecaprenyl-diphosphate phosphatase [Rhodospirillaceae bacterium]MDG2480735.1 undecaprenyl-diphosphate phosphatase [Alphaproteobacteria bacterium]
MTLLQLAVLAIVQGITEFLPISSSGHLILTSQVLGWPDQGLQIDIAVHAGTLLAVIVYFWRDIMRILTGLTETGRANTRPLAAMIIVATIPVGVAGFALHKFGQEGLRDPAVIAWATLGFGILLHVADRFGMTLRRMEHMSWGAAILIGFSQVLALIPGTSRSGITMTAARFMGFERDAAARFSMLLSIPVIAAATLLAGLDVHESGDLALTQATLIAAAMSFVSAMIAIWLLMAWLRRATFAPFVYYRIALGLGLLAWIHL